MKLWVRPASYKLVRDIADIATIFFGRVELTEDLEGDTLIVDCLEGWDGPLRVCTVRLSGPVSAAGESRSLPVAGFPGDDRHRRRQIKLAAYMAFKQGTGIHPPWGALTGIRPTRLVYESLQAGRALDEACERVRRQYDLSEEKAALLMEVVGAQSSIPAAVENDVDVYVSIPFCLSRCRYCSFISACVGDGSQLPAYIDALEEEIRGVRTLMDERGLKVRAFYMGGGTPTALPAPLLQRVLKASHPFITQATEGTVEAGRPDSLDREKLRIIADAGVTRISINPQTMHDKTLRLIGRLHTRLQTQLAYEAARAEGFSCINMDLIAGLPGEDAEMFTQTLRWVGAMKPDHLTVHTLCIKRTSDMHLCGDALPSGLMVSSMLTLAARAAGAMDLRPYYLYRQKHMAGGLENIGYAPEGRGCLYNVDTMEDTVSVLALGAGAVSKRVYPRREHIIRMPNVKDVGHYMSRAGEMSQRKRTLWCNRAEGVPSPLPAPYILTKKLKDPTFALVHEP